MEFKTTTVKGLSLYLCISVLKKINRTGGG